MTTQCDLRNAIYDETFHPTEGGKELVARLAIKLAEEKGDVVLDDTVTAARKLIAARDGELERDREEYSQKLLHTD